jgi:DNA-binding CsgD family transcriptional regulator
LLFEVVSMISKPPPRWPKRPPAGLVATELDEDRVRLAYPIGPPALPDILSKSEQDVVRSVLDGRSNDEIARLRGTSARTVANLLARAFKKLGVGSRAELAAALLGGSNGT